MSDHVNMKHSHKFGMQDDKYNKKITIKTIM